MRTIAFIVIRGIDDQRREDCLAAQHSYFETANALGNITELFSSRVAAYLSSINPDSVDEKQEAVYTAFD